MDELERAYQMLECFGVPRGRAKTVANGIDVLATRYRKDLFAYEMEVNRLKVKCNSYAKRLVNDGYDDVKWEVTTV